MTPARIQEIKKQAKPIAKQDQEISRERRRKLPVKSYRSIWRRSIDAANYRRIIIGIQQEEKPECLFTIEDSKAKDRS